MIIAPKKRIIVPRRFGAIRRQRGYIVGVGFNFAPGDITFDLSSLASSYSDIGGATNTYAVQVYFQSDATVDVFRDVGSDLLNEQVDYSTDVNNSYVMCEYVSGSHMTAGSGEDTWLALSSVRNFTMRHTSGGGPDTISGVFKFHLSSSASGPAEESTGNVTITVGEIF